MKRRDIMPSGSCRECEHWYPYKYNNGNTGMCAANYKHEQPASMWPCRNYEKREGYTYYVDEDGNQVSAPVFR